MWISLAATLIGTVCYKIVETRQQQKEKAEDAVQETKFVRSVVVHEYVEPIRDATKNNKHA